MTLSNAENYPRNYPLHIAGQHKGQRRQASLRGTYQLHGKRIYYAFPKLKLRKENWNPEKKKATAKYLGKKEVKELMPDVDFNSLPTEKDIIAINRTIDRMQKRIDKIETRFVDDGIQFTAAMVMDKIKESEAILTKKEEPTNSLLEYIDVCINGNSAKRANGSMVVFGTPKTNFKIFQKLPDVL